ncbi:hypothetical protein [Bifidobacterium oedipodis]|uniref:Uncharacterized protein n=1 Tax=Bifidobacterium oedipodis TaxID=2675322 RepID=A0A7Y0EMY0_9BIFI|nr:hypothetical protein [Bifidobacterium sp. DSM 109957]NMM93112.1 hypothetical protein [Bifidobacterium sp. DSM 109957]
MSDHEKLECKELLYEPLDDVERYARTRHERVMAMMDAVRADTNPADTMINPLIKKR